MIFEMSVFEKISLWFLRKNEIASDLLRKNDAIYEIAVTTSITMAVSITFSLVYSDENTDKITDSSTVHGKTKLVKALFTELSVLITSHVFAVDIINPQLYLKIVCKFVLIFVNRATKVLINFLISNRNKILL